MPLPNTANNGIIRKNITMIPPIKLPTKISGLPSDNAANERLISGMEVNIPSKKNEIANEETFSLREILSTDLIINPEPNQIAAKLITKMIKLSVISIFIIKSSSIIAQIKIKGEGIR